MDLLDVIARRVDGEFTRLKGDGKEFDSSVLNLNQDLLLSVQPPPPTPLTTSPSTRHGGSED